MYDISKSFNYKLLNSTVVFLHRLLISSSGQQSYDLKKGGGGEER